MPECSIAAEFGRDVTRFRGFTDADAAMGVMEPSVDAIFTSQSDKSAFLAPASKGTASSTMSMAASCRESVTVHKVA